MQASVGRPAFSEADFHEWLDEDGTPALISYSHDRYYAHCVKFGLVGSGSSKDEAVNEATNLLVRYLVVSFSEGRSYQDAQKPAPRRIRFWFRYLEARKKVRGIKPSFSRVGALISVPTVASPDTQHLVH